LVRKLVRDLLLGFVQDLAGGGTRNLSLVTIERLADALSVSMSGLFALVERQ
jgi:hypothetical protein